MAKSDTPSGTFSDLYEAMQKRPQPTPPSGASQPPNQPSKEPSKVGTKEPRNLGSKGPILPSSSPLEYHFDINEKAYRSNTYTFTDNELWAIQDLGTALERQYGIKANKYDIVRCGLHSIIEDFVKNKEKSFIVKQLSKKR